MKLPQPIVAILAQMALTALVWAISNVAGVKDELYKLVEAAAERNKLGPLWVQLKPQADKLLVALGAEAKRIIEGGTQ